MNLQICRSAIHRKFNIASKKKHMEIAIEEFREREKKEMPNLGINTKKVPNFYRS